MNPMWIDMPQTKEEHREYVKNYLKDPIKHGLHKKRMREHRVKQRKLLRIKINSLLGNRCIRCGFSDPRALQIDHVNNDGYLERKKIRDDIERLKYILQKIESGSKDYQLLCANCNQIKVFEQKEIEHGVS